MNGIGAAIEGGLLSRAVEPAHGEVSGTPHAASTCANCGATVTGHYCGQCGQNAHVHRSLAAILHDIMHGVLHLDGKLWNTLPLLAFKPGELTRRFIAGERAKFVSPMAMFLFSVFAMFAVFQMVGLTVPTSLTGENVIEEAIGDVRVKAEAARAKAQADVAAAPVGSPARREAEARLTNVEADLANLENARLSAKGENVEFDANLTGIEYLDQGIVKKWRQNPSLMLYKLQANGYKFSWLLIPLSIPFVWLLFAWRRQYHGYDHAVFVTYSLAFMSLLFITMSLVSISPLEAEWAALLFFIGAPLHLYKQLRHAYSLSRFSALWRFFVLLVLIMIVQVLFLQALLVLGAF
jgi:hypothetical protein